MHLKSATKRVYEVVQAVAICMISYNRCGGSDATTSWHKSDCLQMQLHFIPRVLTYTRRQHSSAIHNSM